MKDYLLFSSIGDNYDKAFKSWYCSKEDRNYDIIFIYYGTNQERVFELENYCDILREKKGSKFQNLVNFYDELSINQYKYVWVVDDDIELKFNEINKMFDFINQKKYFLCQPSMHPKGQNSFYLNVNKFGKPIHWIHHTNFIEVGCPILDKEHLEETVNILKNIDNKLTAYGIDVIWQYYFFKPKKYFQVLLNFIVYNPHPHDKKNKSRECLKMGSNEERKNQSQEILENLNINYKNLRIYYKEDLKNNKIIKVNSNILLLRK